MSKLRFESVKETMGREPVNVAYVGNRAEIFAKHVFGKEAMQEFLDKEVYEALSEVMITGHKIDRKLADSIATGMKNWAMQHGATHYTHWFQPLTGATAEKHDSFFEIFPGGQAVEKFAGSQLVQQEPDGSSFPNGGIRSTAAARGYTIWDPTSPAFVYGTTLYIPTIFISYTGEVLDYKTPLLRSLTAIDKAATAVAKYFDEEATKVIATLGWEQEYFLVDRALFTSRVDLVTTGRTLVGKDAPRGQELDDHYFADIPQRVMGFMRDLEITSLSLGIPVKTRHNEVAPNQFELAPIFEEANTAVDHNMLLMKVMKDIAHKHNFEVLLHEKPFAGINGSGKHNNWSLMTNTGTNLLNPGKNPKDNLEFLTFFVNTIKAVNEYEELLRASVASAGNDHRLGANEAPPAIISVFIGSQMTQIFEEIKGVAKTDKTKHDETLNLLERIPEIKLDKTDRNRTSPFAFTGNRFEFRAVGSAANSSYPMTILNMIVAKQLELFKKEVDTLIATKKMTNENAILKVLKSYIKDSDKILFSGNGYAKAWEKEAKKRGLSNHKTTPEALNALTDKKTINLFEGMGVLTKREVHAKYEVEMEIYTTKILIEAKALTDIVMGQVVPAAIKYQKELANIVKNMNNIYGKDAKKYSKESLDLLKQVSEDINMIAEGVRKMQKDIKKSEKMSLEAEALFLAKEIKPQFDVIRKHADKLEGLVDDDIWPLAKYSEMLFTK